MSLHLAMLLPFAVAALFGVVVRPLARALPPAQAVRMVSGIGLVIAVATGFVVASAAFTFVAQYSALGRVGDWSAGSLRRVDPMSPAVGTLATLAVMACAATSGFVLVRYVRALVTSLRATRRLGPGTHGLVVIDDARADAFTLPGVTGRVVVSTAMLRALPPAERRALLAHEASHLRHRHHVFLLITEISAAANPMLRPALDAVRLGVERWADEDAAADIGDRRMVARALALASRAAAQPVDDARYALRMNARTFGPRARALLAPPPRPRRWVAAALAAMAVVTAASSLVVAVGTESRFDRATAVTMADHD